MLLRGFLRKGLFFRLLNGSDDAVRHLRREPDFALVSAGILLDEDQSFSGLNCEISESRESGHHGSLPPICGTAT